MAKQKKLSPTANDITEDEIKEMAEVLGIKLFSEETEGHRRAIATIRPARKTALTTAMRTGGSNA